MNALLHKYKHKTSSSNDKLFRQRLVALSFTIVFVFSIILTPAVYAAEAKSKNKMYKIKLEESQMLDPNSLRNTFIKVMGPIFESSGLKRENKNSSNLWKKYLEEDDVAIGIGFTIDPRDSAKPVFSFTLYIDTENVRDVRAYSHSGWPPRRILKALGIKVSPIAKILSGGYDAWVPFPQERNLNSDALVEYAKYLVADLHKRIDRGKRWVGKTHRWDYKDPNGQF